MLCHKRWVTSSQNLSSPTPILNRVKVIFEVKELSYRKSGNGNSNLSPSIVSHTVVTILRLAMTFDVSPKCMWVRIPHDAESFFSLFLSIEL